MLNVTCMNRHQVLAQQAAATSVQTAAGVVVWQQRLPAVLSAEQGMDGNRPSSR
jgi:hypothetical protein